MVALRAKGFCLSSASFRIASRKSILPSYQNEVLGLLYGVLQHQIFESNFPSVW